MVSNRNLLFQGSIFRCYVSFREGTYIINCFCLFRWSFSFRNSDYHGIHHHFSPLIWLEYFFSDPLRSKSKQGVTVTNYTPCPETNSKIPENRPGPKRNFIWTNHWFSVAFAVSFREGTWIFYRSVTFLSFWGVDYFGDAQILDTIFGRCKYIETLGWPLFWLEFGPCFYWGQGLK